MKELIKSIKKNKINLHGKTVAISGSTGGLGREICFYLSKMGASIIMLDRSRERAEALQGELLEKFPDLCIRHVKLDLEDVENVRAVARMLEGEEIDYLILNAGAYAIPRHKCSSGYDNVFTINFVSPYYLARRLLPTVRERKGKIVAVGSIAHRYSKIDENDIDFSTRERASLVYGNAKRHLMFSLFALDGISVTHPGITRTNITAHYPKLIYAIIKHPMGIIFMRPRKACLSTLCGLFADQTENNAKNEWIGPRIFDIWGLPKRSKLNSCTESEIALIRERAEKIYTDMCQ